MQPCNFPPLWNTRASHVTWCELPSSRCMNLFWTFAQFRNCFGSPNFGAFKGVVGVWHCLFQVRLFLRSSILLLIPGTCRWMCKMLNAAAADRNKDPILEVLKTRVTSDRHLVALEISSGTGQHVIHFAKAFPNIIWQPSEVEAQSISRWICATSYFILNSLLYM